MGDGIGVPARRRGTGSAPSRASSTLSHCVTDPRIVALAPCRGPAGGSCRTPLVDFSKIPSIDIRCARPLPETGRRCSPRTGSADRSLLMSARLARVPGFRPLPLPPTPSVRACHSSNPVPPLPFLPASAAFSAHAVQVCCTLQPILGFAWFQACTDPLLQGSSGGCPSPPRRPAPSPSLETDRRIHARLAAEVCGRIRLTWASGHPALTPERVRRCARGGPRGRLPGSGSREPSPSSHPSDVRTRDVSVALRSRLGATSPRVSFACRAVPTGATPFEAFPSRTASVRFQGLRPDAPSSLRSVACSGPSPAGRTCKGRKRSRQRIADLEALIHARIRRVARCDPVGARCFLGLLALPAPLHPRDRSRTSGQWVWGRPG
jgi:hypothetical protein